MAAPQIPAGWQSAQTAQAANQVASQAIQNAVNKLGLPRQHSAWIAAQWARLPPNQNLHKNCASTSSGGWGTHGPVVQVDTAFEKKGGGNNYRVDIMLDVDDPPPEASTQPPHFGWEVHYNGQRAANGHVALPAGVLRFGRTFKGKALETYGYGICNPLSTSEDPVEPGKPEGMEVELSFKRYK